MRQHVVKVLFAVGGIVCLMATTLYAAEPVVTAARADVETFDLTTLRAVFTLRKRRWSDGQPIRVFVLEDDSPAHQDFVKKRLRMFPYQLRQHWNRVVFSGTGIAPRSFESQEALLNALSGMPNAIGYAEPDALPEGIVVIEVTP